MARQPPRGLCGSTINRHPTAQCVDAAALENPTALTEQEGLLVLFQECGTSEELAEVVANL